MKKTCTIRILDEVNCVVTNLHPDHVDYFYTAYGVLAPNYFFNPRYKLGSWDGKIRYFHTTGKTSVYLLPEIIPKIVKLGYKVSIDDCRISEHISPSPINEDYFNHIVDPETGTPIKLRPYQVDAVNAVIGNNGGIVLAGTGAGKTLKNAVIVDLYGKLGLKTITIVPTADLVEQTRTEFLFWGLDTGEYSGDVKDINHTHVVSTWQALQNNPSILHPFNLVVVDECHGVKGNVLTKLLNENGRNIAYRFGLTGTLPKAEADALSVRCAVGDVQYSIPAHELIQQGWLAKLNIDIVQMEEDFSTEYREFKEDHPNEKMTYVQFKNAYLPEYTAEKRYLQINPNRLDYIAGLIKEKQSERKGNVFCLVDGVNFGKKLTKLIPGAVFVHGKDKKKARREVYDLFKENNNLVVIATIQVASTGLNIKRIFNLMFIDVGKSFIRIIQTIGRGLRKAPDKDSVQVTDICSDLKYSKKHVRERIKFYKEAIYPYNLRKVKYSPIELPTNTS